MKEKQLSQKQIISKTIFSFVFFIIALGIGVFSWLWLRKQPGDGGLLGGIPTPLRKGLQTNESLFSAVYSPLKLARTYPKSEAVKNVRVNGDVGMNKDFDASTWKLGIVKTNGDTVYFSMDDIKKVPKTEVVFDFKCIEGWDQKTWWGGVKFSDFIKYYHLEQESALKYASLKTPDEEYYVGIDMPSIMHPQTLLCYEMNGKPLPMNQGYPLRLIIPVKYGIKHLKRIGTIAFSNDRPADYWAERGYDYYSGH
ncbi:MAG TPA: molybdopterin-dependent oxidoreductase [Flavisolibacter sp.]|nr:molybdopterin-dependent oxidoreductase [Flavisolibacter sp.]